MSASTSISRISIVMHLSPFRRRFRCRAMRMAAGEGAVPTADRSSGVAVTVPPPLPVVVNRMGSAPAAPRLASAVAMSQRVAIGLRQRIRQKPLAFSTMSQKSQMSQPPKVQGKAATAEVNVAHLPLPPHLQNADPCVCRNTKDRAGHPSRHIRRSPKLRRLCKSAGIPSRPALPDRDAPSTLGPRALRDVLVRRDARTRRPA